MTPTFSAQQIAKAKERVTDSGHTIAEWCRLHDVSLNAAYQVLQGRCTGQRGEAYRAAVALGLRRPVKRKPVVRVPSREEAALVHLQG